MKMLKNTIGVARRWLARLVGFFHRHRWETTDGVNLAPGIIEPWEQKCRCGATRTRHWEGALFGHYTKWKMIIPNA